MANFAIMGDATEYCEVMCSEITGRENEFLVSHDIKCDFHIFEVNEKEKRYSNGINYNKWLPYKEVLKRMHRSRCVLEILQKPGEGPTLRSTEAIVYNKKIITNDAGAVANIHTNILCFCAGKI